MKEDIGFIPLSSDLQKADGKTVRTKYFDGDGVHLNERGVANMLRSIVAHIRQPATKAKDSFPQDKKAHPITVQLSRRTGSVTPRALWLSVTKGVGAGSTEKGRDADDTLERVQCTYMRLMGKCNNSATKHIENCLLSQTIIMSKRLMKLTTSPKIHSESSNASIALAIF